MRKSILKSMFAILCLISGVQANAQTVTTVNTTSPINCDGQAYFIDSTSGYTSLIWMNANATIATDTALYLTNLCAGTYSVTASGSSTNADTTITFTIGSGSPCNLSVSLSISSYVNPGLCNGALTAFVTGGSAPYTYSWNSGSTNYTTEGLCANTLYTVTITDALGCTTSSSTSVPTDSTQSPCNGFIITLNTTNISGPSACDGAITSTISGGAAPYQYSWSNSVTTASQSGLCAGEYYLHVTDSLGCIANGWASLSADIDSVLTIYPSTTNVSADGVCDGSLFAQTYGSVGTVTYILSNGSISYTGYFDTLCQGIYTICAYDQSGDTSCVDFIISNPGNNYNNPTYGDSLFIDSIMADLQANCQLDYQGIDSVFITGYEILGDSIAVYWNIVTSSGTTTLTQLYGIGGTSGVYSLGLQVYCPGKALGNYFTATDQIYYGGPLGIKENTLENISVYPNPVTDKLNIRFPEAGDYGVSLYDLTGREIIQIQSNSADHIQLDVNALGQGQYVLKVVGNKGSMTKSIIR